ncbi:diacylglycerol kinase family protein [Planococcus sp. APC 4015]|nr:diacylglycerol kinase family protein [Planococcus sp. APC 4015]
MPDTPPQEPTGRGLLLVRNSRSGTSVIRLDPAQEFARRLPGAEVRVLGEDEDLTEVVTQAMEASPAPSVLGVYGGDGSVSRMAGLARRFDRPLLVVPGGTFNHFARSAGLDDVDAALDAFEGGRTLAVSAISASSDGDEQILALNAVSLGSYPELIEKRDHDRARLGKWLGGIVAAWRTMKTAEPLTIVVDGRRARVWSVFVGIGRNEPDRVATMQRDELTTAILDVRIHHARGSRVRAIASLAFGRKTAAVLRVLGLMPPKEDVERLLVTEFACVVRPEPGHSTVFVHDGELADPPGSEFTLRCTAVAEAVTVYVPVTEPRDLAEAGDPAPRSGRDPLSR